MKTHNDLLIGWARAIALSVAMALVSVQALPHAALDMQARRARPDVLDIAKDDKSARMAHDRRLREAVPESML
ncbi:MAG: hypothetical protein V4463_14515 [Pseudomonadota bacterium]